MLRKRLISGQVRLLRRLSASCQCTDPKHHSIVPVKKTAKRKDNSAVAEEEYVCIVRPCIVIGCLLIRLWASQPD